MNTVSVILLYICAVGISYHKLHNYHKTDILISNLAKLLLPIYCVAIVKVFWHFCGEQGGITTILCANFPNDFTAERDILGERDLRLRCGSEGYILLQQLPGAVRLHCWHLGATPTPTPFPTPTPDFIMEAVMKCTDSVDVISACNDIFIYMISCVICCVT